ncbi:MAG: hypothetical protein ACOY3P_10335, partial [Planctomycetota bacterium]
WDADQLYDLRRDPREQNNLARDAGHADQLAALRGLLTESVKCVGRPFGEFVPGKNTAPSGSWDDQIAQVKQVEIVGKEVVVPGDDESDEAPKRGKAKGKKKGERKNRGR